MMPLSPRDPQLRLPHLAPTSARRYQQHDSHRQLQLLDLAFQGHAHTAAAAASVSAFEYDALDEPLLADSSGMPHLSRPSSARSTRSTHSTRSARSSRGREYADDGGDRDSSSYRHSQQQQHHHLYDERHQQRHPSYAAAYDDFPAQEMSTSAPQDESVLVEASNPELFQAGVEEHAKRLGMDPISDADFLWIARESLVAPLPDGWYHVTATETGAPYYYNEVTGESRWDHPCDDQFRQIFRDLKQKQQYLHSSRRYDHYSSAAAAAAGESDDSSAHTASYYAAGSSYQTLAWQADPRQQRHAADYEAAEDLGAYDSYASSQQQQDWSADAGHEPTAAAPDASDYAYKATSDVFLDQASEYDTESVPVPTPPSARADTALAMAAERAAQQQLRSLEELKAKDDEAICDLRVQLETLTKQLETHNDAYRALLSDKSAVETKFRDAKEQLETYVSKCEDLSETNQTMKRELLAARNRLEAQQDAIAKTAGDGDTERQRLAANLSAEQTAREAAEQQRDDAVKAQSRATKALEDAQAHAAKLQHELTALQAQRDATEALVSASAADASATAAAVAALTAQLTGKNDELVAMRRSVADLETQLSDAVAARTRATESLQTELAQALAERDRALEQERAAAASLHQALASAAADKQELEQQLKEQREVSAAHVSEAEEQQRTLKRESRALERDLKALQTVAKEREEALSAASRQIEALESRLSEQETLVESARRAGFAEAERASAELVRQSQAEKARVAELYAQELQARRKLHNRLMELQGNIRVFCRVRPIQPVEMKSEQAAPAIFFREDDHESLELLVGATEGASSSDGKSSASFIGQKHAFEFDHVFQPSSSQAQVFEQTRALVVSALDGFNVCIFAYGQTGSGKTHTMEGTESDRGVNFRALQELFRIRDDRVSAGGFECAMKLSILEVYNETIVDLLDNSSSGHAPGAVPAKGLDVRMGKTGVYVDNLIEVEVFNETDVLDLMKLGHSHRSVGSHDFNEHSSRSHLVLSIQIETLQRAEPARRRVSKLHLIDLAGSERVSKTAASGQRLKEAQNINRSLSALGDVIAALGASSKHVPYRNSKLTFLLQDSLSGNSKVLMFVNVSPVQWNAWETLCSLNFASRCRNVALGQAKQASGSSSGASAAGSSSASAAPSAMSPVPNGTSSSSGGARAPPRGAPPLSAPKTSQRITYG